MSSDDIIKMAREAGIEVHERKQQARFGMDSLLGIDSTEKLKRFARLVSAAERDALAKDAARYQWLEANAGAWSCTPSPGSWFKPDGTKFNPLIYFSANNVSYGGLTLDEAIDKAIEAAQADQT